MSYILDALRKSEQERQRGRVPDLNSYQDALLPADSRRNIWPWIAGLAVVVNLTVVLVIWAPWRAQPVKVTAIASSQPQAVGQPAATPDVTSPNVVTTPVHPSPAPSPQSEVAQTASSQPPAMQKPDSAPVPTAVVDATRKPLAKPLIIHPEADMASSAQEQEPPPPKVAYMPQLDELPPAERKDVPDMTFSSHMYSSIPRFRSVIINGKRLKEGDYFTPKIQLREITDNGVIMSDGKTLFSVDVLGRWAQ